MTNIPTNSRIVKQKNGPTVKHKASAVVVHKNGLPNALIDDKRLGHNEIVLAAYKASKGPGFALNATDVLKKLGFSRDVFKAAVRKLKACGWLDRKQPRRSAKGFAFAVDRLEHGPANQSGGRPGYLIIQSDWFAHLHPSAEERLSYREFAVWMFVKSQKPGTPVTIGDVVAGAGYSQELSSKCLRRLAHVGVISRTSAPPNRRMRECISYCSSPPNASHIITPNFLTPENTSTLNTSTLDTSTLDTSTQLDLDSNFTKTPTKLKNYCYSDLEKNRRSPPKDGLVERSAGDFDPDAWVSKAENFWVHDECQEEGELYTAMEVSPEDGFNAAMARVNGKAQIQDIARGRISRKLMDKRGIKGFCTLVHFAQGRLNHLHATLDESISFTVCQLKRLFEARPASCRLNCWGLLGMSMINELKDIDLVELGDFALEWTRCLKAAAIDRDLEDHCGENLFEDRRGLAKFCSQLNWDPVYAESLFISAMASLRAEGIAGDCPDGEVLSTNYWQVVLDYQQAFELRNYVSKHLERKNLEMPMSENSWENLEHLQVLCQEAGSSDEANRAIMAGTMAALETGNEIGSWRAFAKHLRNRNSEQAR